MAQVGSDRGLASNAITGLSDVTGQAVVSTSLDFGSSPLGLAARTQALYSIPNANFSILPPDPSTRLLDGENPLPFWSVLEDSEGRITATSTLNTTTNTWGVVLDPSSGSAITDDTLTMKTRSFLISDDNLSVRQKAYISLAKSGTAGGTAAQWNVVALAEYFDANGSSLTGGTPYAIGTALDTASFTTINGFTTNGGSAISASAQFVDLTLKVTALGTVTGTAKATVTSAIIQSSTGAAGAQSFIISETFTSSTTWTRPTGVDYLLAIIANGGGGGGGGGGLTNESGGTQVGTAIVCGGGGGAGGGFVFSPNTYIGDQSTISVGIGAGGAGGTAQSRSNTSSGTDKGANGSSGGATTFGSYVNANGGGGGGGGSATFRSTGTNRKGTGGSAATDSSSLIQLGGTISQVSGVDSGDISSGTATNGNNSQGGSLLAIPYASYTPTVGSSGGAGTATGGSATSGGTQQGGDPQMSGSGASGPGAVQVTTSAPTVGLAGNGYNCGGSGGGGGARYWSVAGTVIVRGGDGGNAGEQSGAGGGGGGPALRIASTHTVRTNSSGSALSGAGGSGASGWVQIVYVA